MMTPGASVIMTETTYTYESPLGFLLPGAVTLSHDAYRRSRLVDPIPRRNTWTRRAGAGHSRDGRSQNAG